MNDEGMRFTIRAMMTDDSNNYLIGIENGITPEMVLNKLGYFKESSEPYEWSKRYNHATVELNTIMQEITRNGYVAGGMSRSPTYYFIARKGNKREEGLILYRKVKNTTGRMKVIKEVGRNMIDVKKVTQAIRFLEKISQSLEDNPDQSQGMLEGL
jgi:hypothetical protein